MDVSLFDYALPEELIAQRPLERRDASRLMVLDRFRRTIEHRQFDALPDLLRRGDVLVLNDSRVIPARLFGEKPETGAHVEVLLLHPTTDGPDVWATLVRPARRARVGTAIVFGRDGRRGAAAGGQREGRAGEGGTARSDEPSSAAGEDRGDGVGEAPGREEGPLWAEVVREGEEGVRFLRFRYRGTFEAVLQALGEMPLPPYIRERLDDPERYQTVFAREPGSVAAPTAGLHFTPELIDRLRAAGIETVFVTLHVGLGTFRPVTAASVEAHRMHSEFFRVSPEAAEALNRFRNEGRRIIAVGTTAVRALESAADEGGRLRAREGWTDLFIVPGYRFRAVDGLITNFHLPRSTLLMLVAAFAGRAFILEAYQEAIRKRYRFYSFGDAMLIL
ncbi:tRNA preQ1(34) S-adenosylmethionine ribosyltransferase-isomerase QueA [Hydrogenibacillus schlegelii]|uniref:S-adenosylmethionine:tRNA ribosyltransferase-isomerase n=3 Tax=Hydrogenibacillus schlegelii TaxID=1484 RepID=A0A179ITY8_HYDSH|nr:tRNA preQ1(34) S-adenosylmethionine ribosyltransferase-isomerase QueA [Hydrogenibacillus schlegelii]OAR05240.1 hypothetical protein SA87_05610 [Hydrogenibacillus schlegelii]PTQ53509.1 MAG: S-adenosylmethionine:tRNA ribosyltransferase-isomerase [Hydrogenibacillus schlegelii]